jgi:hypothetical protein
MHAICIHVQSAAAILRVQALAAPAEKLQNLEQVVLDVHVCMGGWGKHPISCYSD